jgi:hypothetical protein
MEGLAMKKEYMTPVVEEIKIANTYLLSGSGVNSSGLDGMDGYGGTDDEGEITPSAPEISMPEF